MLPVLNWNRKAFTIVVALKNPSRALRLTSDEIPVLSAFVTAVMLVNAPELLAPNNSILPLCAVFVPNPSSASENCCPLAFAFTIVELVELLTVFNSV